MTYVISSNFETFLYERIVSKSSVAKCTPPAYFLCMEIVRTSAYAAALKRLKKLGASADDIVSMEDAIARAPEVGAVIRGTNGLRKIRFGFGGRGKSSGGRTIYYVMLDDEAIYLLVAYAKSDKEDLTADEKRLFSALIEELTDD